MARKNWEVKARSAEAWQKIHQELLSDGTQESNIPTRVCSCKDLTDHSETRGTYQLSLSEVEELRNHPDVDYVELNPIYHEEVRSEINYNTDRFTSAVKNYRSLHTLTPPTEVANSLMATTGQLNQGTTNWVHVSAGSGSSPAMTYWATLPLLTDYGVYPSIPANPSTTGDPLRGSTQTATNIITLSSSAVYQLEIVIDGEYGTIDWTKQDGITKAYPTGNFTNFTDANDNEIPLDTTLLTRAQVINLGYLTAGNHTITYSVRNGNFLTNDGTPHPDKEQWDHNPGAIAWRLMRYDTSNNGGTGQGQIINSVDSNVTFNIPRSNPTNAEKNRTGYQLLRCQRGTSNTWTTSSDEIKTSNVDYTNDGYDTDVIICDDGVWTGHPEFVTHDDDPPHYIPGNVLARHGRSGVLDLFLDSPYYLDPDWFDADPTNRLTYRWDGTPVPVESEARNWWCNGITHRSTTFKERIGGTNNPEKGEVSLSQSAINQLYTRAFASGSEFSIPGANTSVDWLGSHGTPVASLAYGKNFGWAFNANKWSVSNPLMERSTFFNLEKLFHRFKPDNIKFSSSTDPKERKDPTIVNNSWSDWIDINSPIGLYGGVGVYVPQAGTYVYRGTSGTFDAQVDGQPMKEPAFSHRGVNTGQTSQGNARKQYVQNTGWVHYLSRYYEPNTDPDDPTKYRYDSLKLPAWASGKATENAAIREAISEGIVYVWSASNDGEYFAAEGHPDYDNKINDYFVNRAAFPQQVGYDPDTQIFVIGAMDDAFRTNRWDSGNDMSLKEGSTSDFDINAETLAQGGQVVRGSNPIGNWDDAWSKSGDYTNTGTFVDFYAPADETLAASTDVDDSSQGNVGFSGYKRLENNPTSGESYHDKSFSGTSAAAPVSAGLIACALQQNRKWDAATLKLNMKAGNGAISAEGDTFYKGYTPSDTDPNDPKWMASYSAYGTDIRVIKEYTGYSNTPNKSLTSSGGISAVRPINERFTIAHNSPSIVHKVDIHGIREFQESDSSTPVELTLADGYYPIRVSTSELVPANLSDYRFRVDSTDNQILEISDDDGVTWGDFKITVVNGYFIIDEQRAFYRLNLNDDNLGLPGSSASDPSYTLVPSNFTVNEGSTLTTTVASTNVAQGTTVYWSLVGLSSSDLSSGDLQGTFTVAADGSIGTLTHTFTEDNLTEGDETFEIKIHSDSARNNLLKKITLTLKDTSNAGGTGPVTDPFTPGTSGYDSKNFPDNIKRTHTNGNTTVETAGPYFSGSVPIKFSDIGRYFKNGYSVGNQVKASEYFRNTNPTTTSANVPNATENEFESDKTTTKISPDSYPNEVFSGSGTNLKLSDFRGSVKRYYATVGSISNVGGTIIKNYSMNRWNGSEGIDWDNRNHRDTTSRSDGNLIRNVDKRIFINATCYSDATGTGGTQGSLTSGSFDKTPGARLEEPTLSIRNSVIFVNGRVLGSGGVGGYRTSGPKGSSDPGKHGGTALKVKHTGSTTFVYVYKDAQLYGGGGGGESGAMGAPGSAGSCGESWTETMSNSFCPINSSGGYVLQGCPPGWQSSGWSGGGDPCAFRTVTDPVTGETTTTVRATTVTVNCSRDRSADYGPSSTPQQGIGGAGGNGKGLYQPKSSGQGGTAGTCPSCTQGSLSGGSCGGNGSAGVDGGEWGQPGQNSDGTTGDGGNGGPAICGSPFVLMGDVNSSTVKGAKDGECNGTEQEIEPEPRPDPPQVTITPLPTYVRFKFDGMKLLVTAPQGQTCDFRIRTVHRDSSSLDSIPFSSVAIMKDGQTYGTISRGQASAQGFSLAAGVYNLYWTNLNHKNTNNNSNSGENAQYTGDGTGYLDGTILDPTRVAGDKLEIKLKDGTSPEDDADITILNPSSYITPSTWVKCYQTGVHGTARAENNWAGDTTTPEGLLYPAHNQYWHRFMRELAVFPSITETFVGQWKTQDYKFKLTTSPRAAVGAIRITPGNFTLRMMSDNAGKLSWSSTTYNKVDACYTSDYRGHDGFENHLVDGVVVENHSAIIPVSMPANSTELEVTIRAEIYNNPNDANGDPMGLPNDHTRNPAGIAFELLDTTGNRIFDSMDLPGTERFRPAEVGWNITGRFSTVYGNSTPNDGGWNNNIPIQRNVVAPDLIRLSPSNVGTPVEYTLTVQGEGVDPTATATFEIL